MSDDDGGQELELVYQRLAERAMASAHVNTRAVSRQGCNRMFSDEIVREIRLAKTPQDVKRLMKKYSVSSSTIYQIRALHCYRGVE